jgi:para-nitrobenzyl esterase
MKKTLTSILAIVFACSLVSCTTGAALSVPENPPHPAPSSPQNRPVFETGGMPATRAVTTKYGSMTGVYNEDKSVRAFAGVPFAAPPVGEFRFKQPQPLQAWSGVLACDRFPDAPMQNTSTSSGGAMSFMNVREGLNEDCLYMNIWTGAKDGKEKRPVIVYMYPGGFVSGSASVAAYDGEEMAKQGLVFVTVNSRIGIFGFLPHPDLSAESAYGVSGNYGMFDQLAALKWIQENIAAFGGDPDRVTIAGNSAGGKSVNIFACSPLAKGLFRRGICSSSACFGVPGDHAGGSNQLRNLKDMERQGKEFLENLNLTIEDLRKMPAEDLQKLGVRASRICRPVVDGYLLPDTVYNLFAAGKQNDVQIMAGNCSEEAGPYYANKEREYASFDAAKIKAANEKIYGSWTADFMKVYPSDTPERALDDKVYALSDNQYTWHVREWGELDAKTGKQRVYAYHFSRVPVDSPERIAVQMAFHCGDIPYFYRTFQSDKVRVFNGDDQRVSDLISAYVVNFAVTGDPNGKDLPLWEPYAKNRQFMQLDTDAKMIAPPHEEALNFWEKYEASLRDRQSESR